MKTNDVKKVALLARIELTEDEAQHLTGQFNDILGYIDKLGQIDLEGIEPASHPFDLTNAFREDEPKPSMGAEKLTQLSPDTDRDMIRVPKIIEESE